MIGIKGFIIVLLICISFFFIGSFVGAAISTPLPDHLKGTFPLLHTDVLLDLAREVKSNVSYSFTVSWVMRPGLTNVTIIVHGIYCYKPYTMLICINDKCFKSNGTFSTLIDREEPIIYISVQILFSSKCVVRGSSSPSQNVKTYVEVEASIV